ncbi:hypothetical protein BUALT_Bualt09G0030600 [Buddleja alternifolia]|uniref:GRF zinc finger containing protein n=1 Tax=Buddleja alternifolia TaxID=168488 RepID=A0AAV6X0R0_9LAMI|nr:hypothetical protein BUALT_Bualt09G0030600 [Buddleja alternifolia]
MWTQTAEEFIINEQEICGCGKIPVRRTSWTDDNPGRRYISCKRFGEPNGCCYFVYLDPPMCNRARQIILVLLRRANRTLGGEAIAMLLVALVGAATTVLLVALVGEVVVVLLVTLPGDEKWSCDVFLFLP